MIKRRSPPVGSSTNSAVLRPIFVRHVHKLLLLGYQTLTPASYKMVTEEEITGALKAGIDSVLDAPSQRWMSYYFASEEVLVSDGKRKGKKRKRVDIFVVSSRSSPRAKFSFEAKPLGPKHRPNLYFSDKGLGRFLDGSYASDCDEAGMIGYIQHGTIDDWANLLATYFATKASDLATTASGFRPLAATSSPPPLFCSIHDRATLGRVIHIYHTLLLFH